MTEIVKAECLELTDKQILGYVVRDKDRGCLGRYQLNVRITADSKLSQKNSTDQGEDYRDRGKLLIKNSLNVKFRCLHCSKQLQHPRSSLP